MKHNVFLIGMMGSGKSYWARHLGEWFQVPWFDIDAEIERMTGKQVRNIFSETGEKSFRQMEQAMLHQLVSQGPAIIATGGGLPCFHGNMDFMLQNGMVLWLNPSLGLLAERVLQEPGKRPLAAGQTSVHAMRKHLAGLLDSRRDFYAKAHLIIEDDYPALLDLVHAIQHVLWNKT